MYVYVCMCVHVCDACTMYVCSLDVPKQQTCVDHGTVGALTSHVHVYSASLGVRLPYKVRSQCCVVCKH